MRRILYQSRHFRQNPFFQSRRQTSTSSSFPEDVIPFSLSSSSDPTHTGETSTTSNAISEVEDQKRRVGYLYFDSVFPIRIGIWDIRYLFAQIEKDSLLENIRNLVPKEAKYQTRVEDVLPRIKDGGAFVRFSYIPPTPDRIRVNQVGGQEIGTVKENVVSVDEGEEGLTDDERVAYKEKVKKALLVLEKETKEMMQTKSHKPWMVWGQNRAFLVKGTPWLEDMNRFPNSRIRVEFEGPEIPQEQIYALFRRYGKIHDIIPQPSSNKDLPRYADIVYTSIRSGASARNCLHGAIIPRNTSGGGTTMRILFEERKRGHAIKDWATSHPRIMLPLIVALLGVVSWAIFDPVREFFVKNKVMGTWEASNWRIISWLRRETLGRLGLDRLGRMGTNGVTGIEQEREEAKEKLENWLKDIPDTFIVVTGPRGSGKTRLVDDVTKDTSNVLVIDCAKICKNAKSETKLVSELASSVGYWPQFVLAASLNNMIDLASMGLIGQKAGFSATLDTQLKSILEVTSSALKKLASERNARAQKEAQRAESMRKHSGEREHVVQQIAEQGIRDGRIDTVAGNGAMAELGVGVESGVEKDDVVIVGPHSASKVKEYIKPDTKDSFFSESVGGLPVVVIKSFAAKGEGKQEILWDVLAEWAAVLVENQVAHVVFTSDSVTISKPLAKALPNKPFNSIALNDASPDSALQYIEAKLADSEPPLALPEASKAVVTKLGGRQTDLELLVQKIKAGLEVNEAVDDLVYRNATELRKNFFGDDMEEAKGFKWTREQAWALTKGLAAHPELKYADVLVNSPFKSNEEALRALETAEMISITHREGRPSTIRPGKPVYRSAFQQLLQDKVFTATIEYQINASATASAANDLNSASKTLLELSQLFPGGKWAFGGGSVVPKEIEARVGGLLATIRASEAKLEKLDAEKAELLKVLASSV